MQPGRGSTTSKPQACKTYTLLLHSASFHITYLKDLIASGQNQVSSVRRCPVDMTGHFIRRRSVLHRSSWQLHCFCGLIMMQAGEHVIGALTNAVKQQHHIRASGRGVQEAVLPTASCQQLRPTKRNGCLVPVSTCADVATCNVSDL